MNTDLYEKLLAASFRFLSVRSHSKKEVLEYLAKTLRRWHMPQEDIAQRVLTRLVELGYVDDLKFSQWLIESRTRNKPKGIRFIKQELMQKGVDRGLIDEVLSKEQLGKTSEMDSARKAIGRKLLFWQKLPVLERKKKVYGFLGRRGFSEDTIRKIVDEVVENNYNTENS